MREITIYLKNEVVKIKTTDNELYSIINAIEQQEEFKIKRLGDEHPILIKNGAVKLYTVTMGSYNGE